MPAAPQEDLEAEIAALRMAVGGEVDAIGDLLDQPLMSGTEPGSGPAELIELNRQLTALRAAIARALRGDGGRSYLRADLATLLSLAKMLRAEAEAGRAAFEQARRGVELREQQARAERNRLAAERGELARRRDALQAEIDRTASNMARDAGGECRRTMPVLTLADGITVCSSVVIRPRRFRAEERWLVTLDHTHDHVVIKRSHT